MSRGEVRYQDDMTRGSHPPAPPPSAPSLRRALPAQLPHPLPRVSLHPLARQRRHLPDLLHQYRPDGLLPRCLGRLPRFPAAVFVDQHVYTHRTLDRSLRFRFLVALRPVRPDHGRRRLAAVAAAHLFRHRSPAQRHLEMGDPDRSPRRLLLRAGRACSSSASARKWAAGSR